MRLDFISKDKGAGVIAKRGFKVGEFLGLVAGKGYPEKEYKEIINNDSLNNYIFEVKKLDTDPIWGIDTKQYGNILRFCNHSCRANAGFFTWTIDDERMMRFDVLREIKEVKLTSPLHSLEILMETFLTGRGDHSKLSMGIRRKPTLSLWRDVLHQRNVILLRCYLPFNFRTKQ